MSAGAAVRPRVQKQRNNSSRSVGREPLRELAEPSRWARMDWLRDHSARHGQRMCGMTAAVDEVTVQRGPRGVNFGGLLTCGSRTCPNCGPRIAAQTRSDIEAALDAWLVKPTRRVWFGTFTVRHNLGQSFAELADAVSACWGAATGGRGWMRDREQHGIAHTLRIFEQKWGRTNGWHIHVHVLFFIEDAYLDSTDHSGLLQTMFKRWSSKASSLGLGVPLLRAQDLHAVTKTDALDRIARYFAKETTDASEHTGSIAAEMSNAEGKQGITSLTPGQLLSWAMLGEGYIEQLWGRTRSSGRGRGAQGQEWARMLYNEFERGMKGRRTIAWSRGMREALGLDRELTDDEAAERQAQLEAVESQVLVAMTGDQWRKLLRRRGRRAELADLAATMDAFELVEWLRRCGVHATPHRRDRDGGNDGPAVAFVCDVDLDALALTWN